MKCNHEKERKYLLRTVLERRAKRKIQKIQFKKSRENNLSDLEEYGKRSIAIFSPHGFACNLINSDIRKCTFKKVLGL